MNVRNGTYPCYMFCQLYNTGNRISLGRLIFSGDLLPFGERPSLGPSAVG